jgi:hypothetical protein
VHTAFNFLGAKRTSYSAGWILPNFKTRGTAEHRDIGKFSLPALDRGASVHGRSLSPHKQG